MLVLLFVAYSLNNCSTKQDVQSPHGSLQVPATILVRDGECKESFHDRYVASCSLRLEIRILFVKFTHGESLTEDLIEKCQ